jgi:hypothetical protein
METETREESEARRLFEHMGLRVGRIPSGGTRTPDFLIEGDERDYLVEVKARRDDESIVSTLRAGQVADRVRPVNRDDELERKARNSRRQFKSFDPDHAKYWLLWISIAIEFGLDSAMEQVVGSLYGVRQAVFQDRGEAVSRDCFYARPGVFERWPEIDAAFVRDADGVLLCLNEFSERANEFSKTRVAARLSDKAACLSPTSHEAAGLVLLADPRIDRKDETTLTADLSAKYGRPDLLVVDFSHAWAAVEIPREG